MGADGAGLAPVEELSVEVEELAQTEKSQWELHCEFFQDPDWCSLGLAQLESYPIVGPGGENPICRADSECQPGQFCAGGMCTAFGTGAIDPLPEWLAQASSSIDRLNIAGDSADGAFCLANRECRSGVCDNF